MATLRRGRGPPHVQRATFGTQETRSGPSGCPPAGAQREGRPKLCAEPRPGVGPVHITDEAAEGNEARGGKGSARRELARERRGPDAGPGRLVDAARASERGSKERQAGSIHVIDASRRHGSVGARVLAAAGERKRRSRRRNGDELRAGPAGEVARPMRARAVGAFIGLNRFGGCTSRKRTVARVLSVYRPWRTRLSRVRWPRC